MTIANNLETVYMECHVTQVYSNDDYCHLCAPRHMKINCFLDATLCSVSLFGRLTTVTFLDETWVV